MTPASPTPFFNLFTDSDLFLLGFYILVGMYVLFTAVLYYHWKTYSTDARINFITFIVYFALTIPLIITLAATAIL